MKLKWIVKYNTEFEMYDVRKGGFTDSSWSERYLARLRKNELNERDFGVKNNMKRYVIKNNKKGYYIGSNKYSTDLQDVSSSQLFTCRPDDCLEDGDYFVEVKMTLSEVK